MPMRPGRSETLASCWKQEIICVYGDFDADGLTATALLVTALQAVGGKVGPYIPDRVDEGYGVNAEALERIAQKAQLVVTVDCGIRSVAEAAYAASLGLDLIVTDHHSVGPALPDALAVINPRREDCSSGFERLAGVGVAYRLAQALIRAAAQQAWCPLTVEQAADLETHLLDYVAIGTVADMMPLLGENRSLVQRGLAELNQARRPGLRALMAQSDLQPGSVDAAAISFRLAPRINAAGRLSEANVAYRLLRTKDDTQAYNLAMNLESFNQRRRTLTVDAENRADARLAPKLADDPMLLLVADPAFEPGIVGLVAGRLTERYYRPAIVIEQGDVDSRGSARSIAEFDISRALDEVSELLVRHGGHSRAAGFTVRNENLPEFEAAVCAIAQRELGALEDLRPTLKIDAEVHFDAINWALQGHLARLEPTGQENSAPILLCRDLRVREARTVGEGQHLKLLLDQDARSRVLDAIAFKQGPRKSELDSDRRIDVAFTLEVNEWQGRRQLQVNIEDFRMASD